MENSVEVSHIAKSFGSTRAVADVSFSVQPGEIFGLLGPNGAGKTTAIRIILDLFKPESGTVSVLGGSMSEAKKDRIGYMPEERGLYQDVTVEACLVYLATLKGLPAAAARKRLSGLLQRFDLAAHKTKKLKELSNRRSGESHRCAESRRNLPPDATGTSHRRRLRVPIPPKPTRRCSAHVGQRGAGRGSGNGVQANGHAESAATWATTGESGAQARALASDRAAASRGADPGQGPCGRQPALAISTVVAPSGVASGRPRPSPSRPAHDPLAEAPTKFNAASVSAAC